MGGRDSLPLVCPVIYRSRRSSKRRSEGRVRQLSSCIVSASLLILSVLLGLNPFALLCGASFLASLLSFQHLP